MVEAELMNKKTNNPIKKRKDKTKSGKIYDYKTNDDKDNKT